MPVMMELLLLLLVMQLFKVSIAILKKLLALLLKLAWTAWKK